MLFLLTTRRRQDDLGLFIKIHECNCTIYIFKSPFALKKKNIKYFNFPPVQNNTAQLKVIALALFSILTIQNTNVCIL